MSRAVTFPFSVLRFTAHVSRFPFSVFRGQTDERMAPTPEIELIRLRKQLHKERFVSVLAIVTLIIVLWLSHFGGMVHEIQLDGNVVAWVSRDTTARLAVSAGEEAWRKELGAGVRFPQTIKYEHVKAAGRQPMDDAKATQAIKAALKPEIRAGVIELDGKPLAALKNKEAAQEALDAVERDLLGSRANVIGKPQWKEPVKVVATFIDPAKMERSPQAVVARLLGGGLVDSNATATYTVQAGDNGSAIAQTQGISIGELHRLNPQADFTRLKIGQRLRVRAPRRAGKPLLTVVAQRRRTIEETVPPPVDERSTPNLPRGQRKIVKSGKAGRRRVTVETKEENGVVKERRVTVEVKLQEPEPMIVLVGAGTAPPPRPARPGNRRAELPARTEAAVIVRRDSISTRRLPPPAPPID